MNKLIRRQRQRAADWPAVAGSLAIAGWLTISADAAAYEPDPAVRKSIADEIKDDLVAATPRQQRFSVRFAISGNTPFRDYERLAAQSGYAPYTDCSIATFVEVTNWQIAKGIDVSPELVARLYELCEASESTALGAKPLSQEQGDREVVRGMWQRSLAFVGKQLGDNALLAFVQADANNVFEQLHGAPAQWQLTSEGFSAAVKDNPEVSRAESSAIETDSATPQTATAGHPVVDSRQAIEHMVMRTVTRYGLSGVYVENATYLLLKDGSIFRKPFANPNTMNFATSKREQSADWGQWRARGANLEVTWPGDTPDTWKTWFLTRPAAPGQTLHGQFQSADGFGGDKVANFNTISFHRDGRFSWATLKGGNTVWRPVYSDRQHAGRYEFDGHAIKFHYNDGSERDYAFSFYPKDDRHFVIGANHFVALD